MIRQCHIVLLVLLATVISGCTNISSRPSLSTSKVAIEPGYQYRLPKTSFDVTADFETTGCNIEEPTGDLSISYLAKIKVDKIEVGDPDASYSIDYEALNSITKLTRVELATTPTGIITSFGAKATDLSGPLIIDSVKTIANVSTAIALPQAEVTSVARQVLDGLTSKERTALYTRTIDPEKFEDLFRGLSSSQVIRIEEAEKVDPCGPMKKKLADIEALKANLSRARTELAKAERLKLELSDLTVNSAWLKSEIDFHSKYKNYDQKIYYGNKLKDVDKSISEKKLGLESAQKAGSKAHVIQVKLDSEYSNLRFTKKYSLQPDENNVLIKTISVDQSSLGNLINFGTLGSETISCAGGSGASCIRNYPEVQVKFEKISSAEYNVGGKDKEVMGKDGRSGIFYRIPGEARLTVCQGPCDGENSRNELTNQIVPVSQYGTVGNITLKNMMFSDNQIDLAFHENGTPKTLTFDSKAQSEAARQASVSSAETVLKYINDQNVAIRQSNKSTQQDSLEQFKYEKDVLTERAAIQQILNDFPIDSVDTRIKAYEKQIELLRVQRRLEEERQLLDKATEISASE